MAVIDKRKANTAKMQVNMGDAGQTKPPEQMLNQPSDDAQQGPPPIEQDPEAMQCVDLLKQKGYTADDVERAMGGGEQQEDAGDMGGGQESAQY